METAIDGVESFYRKLYGEKSLTLYFLNGKNEYLQQCDFSTGNRLEHLSKQRYKMSGAHSL
ncbi:MAG: hypothetical protein AAFR99_05055 [Cyanobacteria bacterium J06629_9]